MEVNDTLIENLAHLARLNFNEEEKKAIRQDLEKMIGFVEKLRELDTSDVPPLIHMTEQYNIWREDRVIPSISREEALRNAPQHTDVFFEVPKVINK